MPLPISPPYLCLVTDRRLCRPEGSGLDDAVAQAVEGGVNMVQVREKDLTGGPLLALAERLRAVTRGRALLFVNERLDVALACGADGVQLGEQALPIGAARRVAGDRLLLARSVHSIDGAAEAERQGADLLVVGSVFLTRSHPGAEAMGLETFRRIVSRASVPVLGIGGITANNAAQVMCAGASGVAVISAILAASDPREASRELAVTVRQAWHKREVRRD